MNKTPELAGRRYSDILHSFVEKSLKDNQHKKVLESQFALELALLYAHKNRLDTARYYSALALENFFREWTSMDTLMFTCRQNLLQVC